MENKEFPRYFLVDGYWKDDGTEFSGVVKSSHDVHDDEDPGIFYYGLSEKKIKEAIENETPIGDEFYITVYKDITDECMATVS